MALAATESIHGRGCAGGAFGRVAAMTHRSPKVPKPSLFLTVIDLYINITWHRTKATAYDIFTTCVVMKSSPITLVNLIW